MKTFTATLAALLLTLSSQAGEGDPSRDDFLLVGQSRASRQDFCAVGAVPRPTVKPAAKKKPEPEPETVIRYVSPPIYYHAPVFHAPAYHAPPPVFRTIGGGGRCYGGG